MLTLDDIGDIKILCASPHGPFSEEHHNMTKRPDLTTNDDTSAFGVRLTDLMNQQQIDDREMADATGLAYSTIRALRRLRKVNPTADSIAKLARALRVSPDQLHVIEGTDEPDIKVAAVGAGSGDGGGQFDPARVRAAMRELEKLPVVAAYRDLAASLGL
jgi:transcriptional regulator with XRE-family HTH domain